MSVDKERIERAVRDILEAIGEDPERDGLVRTPERVAAMYEEIFSGLGDEPSRHLSITFEADHDEMVMVRDIPLFSLCEHHLVPFAGRAHVAYIPGDDGRITGLSKIARLVDGFAKRPQVQERLTTQIAHTLQEALQPRGVAVVMEAMQRIREGEIGEILVAKAWNSQRRGSIDRGAGHALKARLGRAVRGRGSRGRARLDQTRRRGRARPSLSLPARHRAPPANGRRRADA